ncbi:MAG: BatD family protein [Bacteroidales bacterium]|nr:BatD family protein [Bacteroidales bacterium]
MKRRILTLLMLLGALTAAAQTLKVEGPGVVSADETFRIVFTADGRMSDFDWPGTEDFDVVWGPQKGSMSSTSIVNGKRTSTHQETVTYLLQPRKTGTFTLAAATATVDKTSVTSSSVRIEVVAAGGQTQSSGGNTQGGQQNQGSGSSSTQGQRPQANDPAVTGTVSNQDIFLRLSLSKTNVVKGEPITATLKLFTRADIAGFEDIKFPTFNGFWSKETVNVNNLEFKRENVGGTIYNAALVRQWVLIPQQTGTLTIDPSEMVCQLRVRTSSGSPLSIFDDFFDQYQTIRKRISTPAINVNVKSLPAGAPASFAGGVGDFKISAKLSKDGIKSNEAASLIVTISGNGNLSMLEAPKVSFPPDFEVYDLKSTDKTSASGTSGSRTFEYPFIPRSHGDFVIPSIEYGYYDYTHGKYATTSTGEIAVSIEKGEEIAGSGVAVAGSNRQSVRNLAEDIRYIALGDGNFRKKGAFFAGSPLFYILIMLLTLLFFLISLVLKRRQARLADVAGSRNRRANKMARARLKNAENYLHKNLGGAYYEELYKALLGYASDKLLIPAADLSKDNVGGRLRERGVREDSVEALIALMDKCEFARYSPDSGQTQMENEYNEAVRVISDIEGQLKNPPKARKAASGTALALILLLGGALSSPAAAQEDVAGLWQKASEAFAAQQWQNALNYYLTIEGENLQSADLYYNIGNTYFKTGDIAHAILYYEKALKLEPSHDDAAHNLEIVRQMTLDRVDAVPDFILVTWFRGLRQRLGADAWAWITLALLLAAGVLFLLFRHSISSALSKVSFILACVAVALAIGSFVFSLMQRSALTRQDSAIVTAPVCSVKSSPAEGGNTVFVLHEGTRLRLLDSVGEWSKIEIADGRQGWAESRTFEII